MEYVIDHDIKVSNNSWGSSSFSQSLYDAIEASQAIGHIFVASAGNSSENIDVYPHYPASYELPNIISIAATDNNDGLAVFPSGATSCFGPVSVDLGAPGLNVYSAVLGSSYGYKSGTSMAAPHVTGVVALTTSRRPDWTWVEVKDRILAAVRPVDSLIGITATGGVLNAINVGDCNGNGIADELDIAYGTSEDCSENGIPDECEPDCNGNSVADSCDILAESSEDCNGNGIPDECEPDCNGNSVADSCDILAGTSEDCNTNMIPDECEIPVGNGGMCTVDCDPDCNANGIPDECDIAFGTSEDCTGNGVPDECEPDCNENGLADSCDIAAGTSADCNNNDIPDECDLADGTALDCNDNGVLDSCDIDNRTSTDCDEDGVPDECQHTEDCNENGLWDGCDFTWRLSLDCNANGVPDECDIAFGTSEDCTGNGVPDECEPDCNENGVADSCDIMNGTSEDCSSSNGVPDECEPDCNENGVADSCDIVNDTSEDGNGNGIPDECGTISYVDNDAMGHNDGSSWADAFTDLEGALASAALVAGAGVDTQIWVAKGRYTPSSRTDPENPRSATFQLLDYMTIHGGFSGEETRFDERDVRSNVTVLSGDLNGDDGPDFANNEENACHVVTGSYADPSAILDGFVITGGNAVGCSYDYQRGGGMYMYDGTPTVTNCTFVANRATVGGGMFSHGRVTGGSLVTNCLFVGNRARGAGGGYYCLHGEPVLTNCVFSGNRAGDEYSAAYGGGMYVMGEAHPLLVNCSFVSNEAIGISWGHGGGIAIGNYNPDYHILATLVNCILWDNHDSGPTDLSAQMYHDLDSIFQIDSSCVQDWTPEDGGTGNINADPMFVDANGPDDTPGTIDDNLRLTTGSPCIDAGDTSVVPPDSVDLDRDGVTTEPMPFDLDGAMRFFDDPFTADSGNGTPPIVDMGAYEYGDCNGNGVADVEDIAAGMSEDCNGNGVPDECDLSRGASEDCNENGVPDECDLSSGLSEDCNGNQVPDECDLADPTIGDCDGNLTPDNCQSDTDTDGLIDACDGCPYDVNKTAPGECGCGVPDDDSDEDTVPDCLDICAGFDDLIDSDSDGTPDGCDRCPGFDDLEDADGDQVPDGCDDCPYEPALAEPSEPGYEITCDDAIDNDCDTLTDEADSDCLCQPADALAPEPVAFDKNRYLSFSSADSGQRTAVRVTLTDLPAPFNAFDDQTMWVGQPREISENAGKVNHEPGWPDSMSANLQCTPYCMDWAEVGLLHLTDDEIVPGAVYNVQAIDCACDFGNDADYSAPLTITTSKWGDLVGTCAVIPCTPPEGVVNMATDVTACVDKFRNLEGAVIKARADVEPNLPDWLVNVSDVTYVLDAFRGSAYPPAQVPQPPGWTGPGGCP